MEDISKWMPLYIGDYLANTIGLTHSQHGAYLLSIFKYWQKGESLTSDELREVAGREVNRVAQFYVWEGNRWHHKRIDQELERARKNVLAKAERGKKGAQARWGTAVA